MGTRQGQSGRSGSDGYRFCRDPFRHPGALLGVARRHPGSGCGWAGQAGYERLASGPSGHGTGLGIQLGSQPPHSAEAGGHYIIGEKMRLGPKGASAEALTRGGKYRTLPNGLLCKEVIVGGDSEARRRFVVGGQELRGGRA